MKKLVLLAFSLSASMLADEHSAGNHHEAPLPTLEVAAASDGSFGNSTIIAPVWKGLVAEGVGYHSQGRNIAFVGGGWAFRPHQSVIFMPTAYAVRGQNEHDRAALGFRFLFENRFAMADLGMLRTFGGKNGEDHDVFMDPSHVSFRFKRMQLGYAMEFFRHMGSAAAPETPVHTESKHDLKNPRSATIAPAQTHTTEHKADEWLHGPRFGAELHKRFHVFYVALYKGNGHWEHKLGTTLLFNDILKKK